MMKSDDIEADQDTASTGRQILAQMLVYIGVSCVGGGLAAGVAIGLEKGVDLTLVLVAGGFTLAGIAAAAGGIKIGDFDPPSLKSKAGRSQLFMLGSIGVGLVSAMYLIITGAIDRIIDGTFTPSPGEALVGVLMLATGLVAGLFWQREMDEHELEAVKTGAYWGLSAYFYGYPAWWLTAAAGLVPGVDDGALFFAVVAVFLAVWFVKRAG
ncbi:MAG: hypothetical protein NBV68_11170 [Erythrobacter sp.]|uniref:hypothetical protein n=1 Tax=Erythrobacter sp. TaxID=1042 RepID=UPI0025E5DE27|nr:hypothetical protein [Erythrobacter sp.]MCL9999932.1 hypothetical protein [Erythrobacter sp.]